MRVSQKYIKLDKKKYSRANNFQIFLRRNEGQPRVGQHLQGLSAPHQVLLAALLMSSHDRTNHWNKKKNYVIGRALSTKTRERRAPTPHEQALIYGTFPTFIRV